MQNISVWTNVAVPRALLAVRLKRKSRAWNPFLNPSQIFILKAHSFNGNEDGAGEE